MRSTRSASNCRIHRPQFLSLIITAVLSGLAAQQAAADFVFRAEANFGSPLPLHIYNTITDSWSIGANLPAGNTTQLASNGVSVFALPGRWQHLSLQPWREYLELRTGRTGGGRRQAGNFDV